MFHAHVGDGNCGFHCIALALGMSQPNAWRQVRLDLLDELRCRKDWLISHFGGIVEYDAALKRLDCDKKRAPPDKWMDCAYDSLLIANYYNIIFCTFNRGWMATYYPSFFELQPKFEEKIFGIALIENVHYVHIQLKPDCPLPPPWYIQVDHSPIKPPVTLKDRFEAWNILNPISNVNADDPIEIK